MAAATWVPLPAAAGRVAAGWVAAYPPGIPLWIPGERITEAMVEWALTFQAAGGSLRGLKENMIPVMADGRSAKEMEKALPRRYGKEEMGEELSNL